MTDPEPGTYGAINRDDYPALVTIGIPFYGKHLLVWAMKFKDGRVAQVLMMESEWAALPEETRERLSHKAGEWKEPEEQAND
jgi:hypothetical protein